MARLIQTINTSEFSSPSPDPAGIAFINNSNSFLISDSEVNETPIFEGNNLFQIGFNGNVINTGNVLHFSSEPTGLTYDSDSNTLFISDDAVRRVTRINSGIDGTFGTSDDNFINTFSTRSFGSTDPEDLAFRPSSGTLFVADGLDDLIYEVDTSGNFVSSFSTSSFGLSDPEGIGFDSESGNLFIVGEPTNTVFEVTTSGTLIQTINISEANPVQPAGVEITSSSDGSGRSIYIVDRGIDESVDINENDGRLYEFSLEDDNPGNTPDISIADASIVEGDNGNDDLNFTVSLSETSQQEVTVDFTTNDGSAIAGEDYIASNGIVTFAPGETSQTITLGIIGDTIVEDPEEETFSVNLSNASGGNITDGEATGTITDNDDNGNPGGGNEAFFATTRDTVNLNGNTFDDEDIILYDPTTQTWSQYVDGSDIGLASNDIDGVHVNSDGTVLLSLEQETNIDGLGQVDDSDILLFVPTSTGNNTAGSLELYFDGSDVGFTTNGEDVDAISIAANGDLLLSTFAGFAMNQGQISGRDEDIIRFSPASLGNNTTGSLSLYFDGSDVGLGDLETEDLKGVSLQNNGEIVLSTQGNFDVPGLSGGGSDLISFNSGSLGDNTSGSFSLISSGAGNGLGNQVVADISFGTVFDSGNLDPNLGSTPEISIADASIVEGDNGNNDLNFTISLSEASQQAVTVDFSTNDGSAIAGEDYVASNGIVTFAPGETSQTITLSIIGDTVVEDPEEETFSINLSNVSGGNITDGEATGTITDNDDNGNPGGGGNEAFYATTRDAVNLNSNTFEDEDIIVYDPTTQTWSQYVDGSDIGLASNDIDGVHVNSDGSVLLSLNQDINLDGLGRVDDADILRFIPTSTGDNTAGSLELYFDGSDVGLDSNGEDIDGLSLASNGDILITTNSSYNINGLTGGDEDILAFSASSLGENTAGSFSLYVDGSDIEFNDSSEDIKGLSAFGNELVLSTVGGFNVPGLSGGGSDLTSFNPNSLGDNTSGSFSSFSSGADNGLGNQVVADISIV